MRERRLRRQWHAWALAGMLAGALTLPAGAGVRAPAVAEFAAVYDIYFGGLKAGEATSAAAIGDGAYRASLSVETKGLIGVFIDEAWRGETIGRIEAGALIPVRHWAAESDQAVEVAFAGGAPQSVRAEPALDDDPWSIEARDQQGVTDPVSALITLLAPVPAEAACGRRVEAFDGEHRFALELGAGEREGGSIRCDGAFVRLAGYKPKKIGRREAFRVHYAERTDGLMQVVRVALPTDFGIAVMRLRD